MNRKWTNFLTLIVIVGGSLLFLQSPVCAGLNDYICTGHCATGCGPKCKRCFADDPSNMEAQSNCCGDNLCDNADLCSAAGIDTSSCS